METLKNLIRLTHCTALNNAIDTYRETNEIDNYETSTLLASLYADDNFSEYSINELQAAISELITEY